MATQSVEELAQREYQYGFITDIEADTVPPGLNEDVIRLISAKKNEPESTDRLSGDSLLLGAKKQI
jgi:Fe-S cluster assembly protein SufB